MSRRPTFSEQRWPIDNESLTQASRWAEAITTQVLDWTWRAFDQLRSVHLSHVNLLAPLEQLERDLTSKHFIEIQRLSSEETGGFCSVVPHHEFPEMHTRPNAPGKPPSYDLAFVCYENQRIAWPIEAKVLKTANTLAPYLDDVRKFTDGTAAPLVGEGGLIAYLLAGAAADLFEALSVELAQPLQPLLAFLERPHLTSHHDRDVAPDLRLHHMVMHCGRI
jgi:hypothetical protein